MNNFLLLQSTAGSDNIRHLMSQAAPKVKELNMWDLAIQGGWVMIPIVVLSVIAIYIFVERYIAIRKAAEFDESLMEQIKDHIYNNRIEKAKELCEMNDTPTGRMLLKGISRIGSPLGDINSSIENIGNLEISRLEKGLPTLASVSGGAPMIGFLGTVIGMIQAFYDMSNAGGNVDVTMLSGGIYQAMVTTVAGLTVGIIGYFTYNILVAKVEKVVYKMELMTSEFMDILNNM